MFRDLRLLEGLLLGTTFISAFLVKISLYLRSSEKRKCWNVCQEAPLSWVVFVFDKITTCDCLETEECRNGWSRKDLGTDDTYVVKSNSIFDTKRSMSL